MGLLSRKQKTVSGRDRPMRTPGAAAPSPKADAQLDAALKAATAELQRLPVRVRAAGYRVDHGELQVAVVVAGDEGLHESLDRLGSPRLVQDVLDNHFACAGMAINAAYNNDRTWADRLKQDGGWLAVQEEVAAAADIVRTVRPSNPEAYGARAELPPSGHLYVAQQARMYGATPMAAAELYRQWMAETSWVTHTYQVVNSVGQAYSWNSGGWSEDWLLVRPDGEGFLVTWDTVVQGASDDPNDTMRLAGGQLESAAQAGELEVFVVAPDGGRSTVMATVPS